jgi:hypothetical protein
VLIREKVVLVETNLLGRLIYSVVGYVTFLATYKTESSLASIIDIITISYLFAL